MIKKILRINLFIKKYYSIHLFLLKIKNGIKGTKTKIYNFHQCLPLHRRLSAAGKFQTGLHYRLQRHSSQVLP